jgi:hypothetical protein
MKMENKKLSQEKIVLFGREYLAVEPADGFRIAVETAVVKWRLEDALVCLDECNAEKAVELLYEALRELKVAECFHQVPMLVYCPSIGSDPHDQHGPTEFQL